MQTTTYHRGDKVESLRPIFDNHHATLWIVRARHGYRCEDNTCNQRIAKGDLCGADGYGAVHFCIECIRAATDAR